MSNDIAEMKIADDPVAAPPANRYRPSESIRAAVAGLKYLSPAERLEAFAQANPDAAGYRPTEALVTCILEALEAEDKTLVERLFRLLRARATPYIRGWIGGVANRDDRIDIESAVIAKVTEHIVRGGTHADYPQAKFWNYLHMRTISAITEFQRRQRQDALLDDLEPDISGGIASAVDAVPDPQISAEDFLLMQEAILALPEPLRETYILRHAAGWRVGDERKDEADPDEPTLMEHFGLTRRAVDKRLARAEAFLAQYRKDPA